MNDWKLHQQILCAEARSLVSPEGNPYCVDCHKEDCVCPACEACGMKFESIEDQELCDCGEREKREICTLEACKVEREMKLTEGNNEK